MFDSASSILFFFTAGLVAVLVVAQQLGREFLAKLFHDTGRRSEGRRRRRAFEWSMRAWIACLNYCWAVQEIRELTRQLAPSFEGNLVVLQVSLAVVGVAFVAAAVYQLKEAIEGAW